MRILFFFLMVTLIVLPAAASGVLVQAPKVSLVPLSRVHDACGSGGDFDACTVFVSYHLDARCSSRTIDASVTFQPMIFLHNIHLLSHEQEHIDDIRRFAEAYVTNIEQKRFETESQCRAETQMAMNSFGTTMREFAQRSMRHIH